MNSIFKTYGIGQQKKIQPLKIDTRLSLGKKKLEQTKNIVKAFMTGCHLTMKHLRKEDPLMNGLNL